MATLIGDTVIDRVCVPVLAGFVESVTCTVNVDGPTTVGVPDNAPDVASFTPAGSAPATSFHVYGDLPPTAVNVALYAASIGTEDRLEVVTATTDVDIAKALEAVAAGWLLSVT